MDKVSLTLRQIGAMVRLAGRISMVDGGISKEEKLVFTTAFKKMRLTEEQEAKVKAYFKATSYDEACALILDLEKNEKIFISAVLIGIIATNGGVTQKEFEMWQTIREDCHLPAMTFEEAMKLLGVPYKFKE